MDSRERCEPKNRLELVFLREDITWRQKAKVELVNVSGNNWKLFHAVVNDRKGSKINCRLER